LNLSLFFLRYFSISLPHYLFPPLDSYTHLINDPDRSPSSPTAASPATPAKWSPSIKATGTNPAGLMPITNSNQSRQADEIRLGNPPAPWEKKFGKHPTQKPVALLERILLASTNAKAT
jgi:hypothetical protein